MKRIGYLGPKGTFSHEALIEYVGNSKYEEIWFTSIPDLLFAVHENRIDEAIVPIENSLEGGISATLDILAQDIDIKIKKELVIEVNQHLLVRKGTKKENIKRIISHPQPIGQCRKYLHTKFKNAEIELVYSTAGAAVEIAKCNFDGAAIASKTAAKVYDLEIIESGIQDNINNSTRFIIVTKEETKATGNDKTSLVFSTDDKAGSLFRILNIFNLWNISMTRIESRPAKHSLGRYIFFVDIKGHAKDDDINDAITMIKKKTSFFKDLGSYPRYMR